MFMRGNSKVGDLLVSAGVITQEQLERALAEQKKVPNVKLGQVLVQFGFCSSQDVMAAISRQLGFEVGYGRKGR
jgi:Ni,Fe-hydrogenase III small subunit